MPQSEADGFDTSMAPDHINTAGEVGANPYHIGPREVAHRAIEALREAGDDAGGINYETIWQGGNGVVGVVGVELDGTDEPTAETVLDNEFSEITVRERDLVTAEGYTIAIVEA